MPRKIDPSKQDRSRATSIDPAKLQRARSRSRAASTADLARASMGGELEGVLFSEFARQEFSGENLEFVNAVTVFKEQWQQYSPQERREQAIRMYNTFIAPDSPKEININAVNRRTIATLIGNASFVANANMFDNAYHEAQNLLQRDTTPRFKLEQAKKAFETLLQTPANQRLKKEFDKYIKLEFKIDPKEATLLLEKAANEEKPSISLILNLIDNYGANPELLEDQKSDIHFTRASALIDKLAKLAGTKDKDTVSSSSKSSSSFSSTLFPKHHSKQNQLQQKVAEFSDSLSRKIEKIPQNATDREDLTEAATIDTQRTMEALDANILGIQEALKGFTADTATEIKSRLNTIFTLQPKLSKEELTGRIFSGDVAILGDQIFNSNGEEEEEEEEEVKLTTKAFFDEIYNGAKTLAADQSPASPGGATSPTRGVEPLKSPPTKQI